MQGFKSVVSFPEHRKELVAGNLREFLTTRMQQMFCKLPHVDFESFI